MSKIYNSFITVEDIIGLYESNEYPYLDGNYKINIFGFRDTEATGGRFNDTLGIFFKEGEAWKIAYYPALTVPSKEYLLSPLSNLGAFFLKEGFHENLWALNLVEDTFSLVQTSDAPVGIENGKTGLINYEETVYIVNSVPDISTGNKFYDSVNMLNNSNSRIDLVGNMNSKYGIAGKNCNGNQVFKDKNAITKLRNYFVAAKNLGQTVFSFALFNNADLV